MDDLPPIVLDQGTGFVKVGYAGQSKCALSSYLKRDLTVCSCTQPYIVQL